MNTEELKQIARDFYAGKCWTSASIDHLSPEDFKRELLVRFPILQLTNQETLAELEAEDPVIFFEYYHAASIRGVNGGPCFFSVRYLGAEDYEKVRGYMKTIDEAL